MQKFLEDIAYELAKPASVYRDRALLLNMHALPTTVKLLDTLFAAGFRSENTLFVGKPYSTILATQKEICRRGVTFRSVGPKFRAGRLESLHRKMIHEFVRVFLLQKHYGDYLLLDSGGHLTTAFESYAPELPHISVQLTSSGSRLFAHASQHIVDLGANEQKRGGESVGIGSSIVGQILKAVPDFMERKIAVIGNGAIGKAVAWQLQRAKIEIGHYEGKETAVKNSGYDVVIGATGYDQSKLAAQLVSKTGAADLFSASSWDIEFMNMLCNADKEIDLRPVGGKIVETAAGLTVHNAGCPINFNRITELESERDMAMTRGLTLAAALDPIHFKQNMRSVGQLFKLHYGA